MLVCSLKVEASYLFVLYDRYSGSAKQGKEESTSAVISAKIYNKAGILDAIAAVNITLNQLLKNEKLAERDKPD